MTGKVSLKTLSEVGQREAARPMHRFCGGRRFNSIAFILRISR